VICLERLSGGWGVGSNSKGIEEVIKTLPSARSSMKGSGIEPST